MNLASGGIAFFEYCLAVPANRWGHGRYDTADLKTMQEVITLVVFAFLSVFYLCERVILSLFAFKGPIPGGKSGMIGPSPAY